VIRTRWLPLALGAALFLGAGAGAAVGRAAPRKAKPGMTRPVIAPPLQGRTVLRRLNRVEYQNTLRDLLGIEMDVRDLLPEDSASDGFDNVGEALHISPFLMERYLEAANRALDLAIANGPQPPYTHPRHRLHDELGVKISTERVFLPREDALVMFSSSPWNAITMGQFYPPHRGRYRFRISASGYQSDGKPVVYRIDAGPMLMGTRNHLVGYFDAPSGKPGVAEFVDYFEARSTIRISPYGLANAQTVDRVGAEQYTGPGLAVHYVEVEGPLHDTWPPESHRRIFGSLAQAPAPIYDHPERVEVASTAPEADAARILRRFARRAFRRSVSDGELRPYRQLVQARLKNKESFERAIRVGLTAILVSDDFLYLHENPGKLDDFALASRLSYFFWNSMPDEVLLAAAARKELTQGAGLHRQVERMLADPRSSAFVENFVGQWLGLRSIDFTEPSGALYPEFDDLLKESMVREPEAFFAEVLKRDLSLTNFVGSDFTMLNGRLAKHYGIPGVEGYELRRTPLPAGCHRGGVLTMAGVLKVTANGTTTSPVTRGAWVLDRILGTPPPPPPANVPAVEPDIRGATTIRQQLAKHRAVPACAGCHSRIDPPGFALESFDVIGGWREHYRSTGNGEEVVIDGRRMPYLKGPKVDPAGVLPDGGRFTNIDDLKRLLLRDPDPIARALTAKLVTYATGGRPRAADGKEVAAIVAKIRKKNYGFRTLIQEIAASPLFRDR
jgi:hypothetical protein